MNKAHVISSGNEKCEVFCIPKSETTEGAAAQTLDPTTEETLAKIRLECPRIKTTQRDNHLLLGAPILEEAVQAVLLSKLDDLKRMTERLTFIDVHNAIYLLRNCYAIPRLTYFLRSAPCFKSMATLELYDQEMRRSLQEIINIELERGPLWEFAASCSSSVSR